MHRKVETSPGPGGCVLGVVGAPGGRSGAVVLAQRFGGALNLNLPFHALVLDGVYTSQGLLVAPRFQPAPDIRDEDVARVTAILHRRILRYLQRGGRLQREDHAEHDEPLPDEPSLALMSTASWQFRRALSLRRSLVQ